MHAYGIFDGGGVKGAALAGCLAAAQEQGIQFVGYGGTSAGSMVALLAEVGYTGQELGELLIDLDFRDLLDDKGEQLARARASVSNAAQRFRRGGCWGRLRAICAARPLSRMLGEELGLDSGEALKRYLFERIKEKHSGLSGHADITFEHLEAAGCLPLKIVASDITRRRPAIFSRQQTDYGASVLDAVRASTSYPFAFRPVVKNGRCLVDGGLASNLPAFLFDEEYRETRVPALAFDLTAPPGSDLEGYDFGRFSSDLLATALEASDELLRRVLRGVHHVPVETPPGIETLNFAISRDDRRRLYDAGYKAATEFLNRFELLQRVKAAGDEMKRQLQVEFGSPQLYQPVLYGLAKQVEAETQARKVRAHVMLPTGRPKLTRIVVYGYGMDHDADADLELAENAGCSGVAWAQRAPAIADLEEAAVSPEDWGMTLVQHAKVPANRKAMLCVPIHRQRRTDETGTPMPIATLAVDTVTALARTGWLARSPGSEDLSPSQEVVAIMVSWANVLYRLLRKEGS